MFSEFKLAFGHLEFFLLEILEKLLARLHLFLILMKVQVLRLKASHIREE